MKLNEMFGFGPKKPADVHKLMKDVDTLMTRWGQYLHLAHSRSQYEENVREFDKGMSQYSQLYERYVNGEDISAELEEFKVYVKPMIGRFGSPFAQ